MQKDLLDKLLKASEECLHWEKMIDNKSRRGSGDWFISNPMVSNIINDFLKEERSNFRKEKIKRLFPDE
jgi:hypothetical protein